MPRGAAAAVGNVGAGRSAVRREALGQTQLGSGREGRGLRHLQEERTHADFPGARQQTKMLIPLIKEFRTPGSLFSPTTSTASRGSGPMRSTGCRPTTVSTASTSTRS